MSGGRETAIHVALFSPPRRIAAAALLVAACASLPVILLAVIRATDPPITPPVLFRTMFFFSFLPALGAWLLGRVGAAEAVAACPHLVLRRRGGRIEIPARAIVEVIPWTVPLPAAGVWLRLESGRRFRHGLAASAPSELVGMLASLAAPAAATAPLDHPTLVYAEAKRATGGWRWYHYLAKFVLFGALPAAVLFNAHQYIAYGGTFGQWYLEGPGRYLETLAIYWSTVVLYLVLYAAVWRGAAEAVALLAAHAGREAAVRARRAVETFCRIAFYAGVPLLLLLRFSD